MARRKRILLVFGTRPEAIKMAPVYRALRARPDAFETLCCVTGQHRDMLDQVLDAFDIAPEFDLDLMRSGQDLSELHSIVLVAMRRVLDEVGPDVVLVHGDTTTSVAAALAAFYAGIAVGHVEAGLRSGSLSAPFPEEFNRRVTGMIARFHFAPTTQSREHLLREGCDPAAVSVTGNTVVDALRSVVGRLDGDLAWRASIDACLDATLGFNWSAERFIVVTCHRRENAARRMEAICSALTRLAEGNPRLHFVLPLHPNPTVRGPMANALAGLANFNLVEPLPYPAFIQLLRLCHCVLTDSGGLQEEAPALGKPVLVMRDVTERPEAVDCGSVRLVGTDPARIVSEVSQVLDDSTWHARMAQAGNPFGDGRAAERIVAVLQAASTS